MEKKNPRNSSKGQPQQSQTVLIIEDDQALAGLLQKKLQRLGLEVEIALTGADAIDRLTCGNFDLALLDYRLPDMNGVKVIETLAEQKRTIPFIVTTGHGDERTAVELMRLGARDYLVKDATFLDRLPQVVERTLQELDTERRLAEAEEALQKQTHELAERMKELRCLFSLDELMKQKDTTVKQFLDRLVSFIPAAMQYPEISTACITLDGKRHKNKGFKKTKWILQNDIIIEGKKAGSVQICYSEERPEADIGPFLKEEKALVSSIAKQVGIYIEGRRSREALRESEERYKSLFNRSLDLVYVHDFEGNFIDANQASLTLLGYKEQEIKSMNFASLLAPDQLPIAFGALEEIKETGQQKGLSQYKLRRKNGEYVYVETKASVVYKDEKPWAIQGIGRDITERKQAEGALRRSEEEYKSLVENSIDGILVGVREGRHVFANQRAVEITGYSVEELLKTNINDLAHPDEVNELMERFRNRLEGKPVPQQYETIIVRKDGKNVPVEIAGVKTVWMREPADLVFIRDITERKRAEMERERLLHELDERVIELNCLYGISNVLARQYDTAEQLFQEILKVIMFAWYYSETVCARIISEGKEHRTQNFRETPWRLSSDILVRGEPVGAVEVYYLEERPEADEGPFKKVERDLINAVAGRLGEAIERKRVRDALRESEIRYRDLFEEAPAAVTVVDMSGMIVNCNTGTEELTGYAKDEILGKRFDELMTLDPHDLPRLASTFEKLVKGEVGETYELEITRRDGERRWIRVRNSLLMKGGEATGIQIYAADITESKLSEVALRESEERYRDLFEGGIDGTFVIDAETMKLVLCNKRATQIYGYDSPELAIGINPLDFIHPDDRERARRLIVEDMLLKDLRQVNEFRTLTRGGEEVWISAVGTVIDYQGKPAGLVSFRDITEQKRAQEEIKRQTKRAEALYTVTQAVSKTLDLDELVNEALKTTLEVMNTGVGGIYVAKFESRELVLKAHSGVSQEFINEVGIVKLSDEELARGLKWTEPVFEPEKVFVEANLERYQRAIDADGLRSIIIVPFWSRGVPQGGLVLADRHERKYSPEEIELLKAIVNEIAIGIENASLLEKTKEMSVTDELTGIYNRRHFYNELDTEIHRMQRYGRFLSIAMLDLDEFKNYNDTFGHTNGDVMLRSIAQTLKSSLRKSDTVFRYGGDEFIIILPGTDAETAKKIIDRIRSKWAEIHREKHQKFGKPIGFSTGIAQFPDNANTPDGLVFLTDAALFYAKRRGGAQSMMASELNTLSPEILSMATREQVYALSATVDAKDPYTYGHSNRVAAVAETIAKSIGMSGKDLADVYAAAMLHDIGKLGVPDAILTKSDKLTDAEWKIIYQHPAEGAKIIVHVKELSRLIPMIRHHHEWWDGNGYPDRLKGDEIPLGARIISLADAYDTMTTKRLYRNVITPKEALKELKRCSGSQFDPELVQSFSRSMEKDSK